jgi:hypothetical protein
LWLYIFCSWLLWAYIESLEINMDNIIKNIKYFFDYNNKTPNKNL